MSFKYLKILTIVGALIPFGVSADDIYPASVPDQKAGYPAVNSFFDKGQVGSSGFFEGRNLSGSSLLGGASSVSPINGEGISEEHSVPEIINDEYGLSVENTNENTEDSYVYSPDKVEDNLVSVRAPDENTPNSSELSASRESLDQTLAVAAEEASSDERVQSVLQASREIREAIFGKEVTKSEQGSRRAARSSVSGVNIKPKDNVRF
ncbi:MAG TPA: hypothetical protein PKA63_06960 [Oligoflexia bacterium]|nr:hypothetical protein [Oligoflexia bacterium]HMP48390.1 hypothetical protein [Oligoflexia bacterium]